MSRLRIGTDDFKKLRLDNGFFADKSLLIKEIVEGSDVLLLPRPRRFGKTLNITMLKYFFDMAEPDGAALFDGLAVSKLPDVMRHLAGYPVIYLTLKNIKGDSWEAARSQLVMKLARLFSHFQYALAGLDTVDARVAEAVRNGSASDAELHDSLRLLIATLYSHHKRPVVVLIDEYDSPVIEARFKKYYKEMVDFMRGWLGGGLKHDEGRALYRGVITGILRIAKESIFSELNNLGVHTVLTPGCFSDKFGFTQADVDTLMSETGLEHLGPEIRKWYNGYSFGGVTIYNPWSVLNRLEKYQAPPEAAWVNTSSNALVYELLEKGGLPVKEDLEKLLAGEALRRPVREDIIFADLDNNLDTIWSLLLFSGYLKAEDPQFREGSLTDIRYKLSIPNLEVSIAYERFANRAFAQGKAGGANAFMDCFLQLKGELDFQAALQDLATGLLSCHDVAKLPEAVFHAFVLGLLANLRGIYEIRSNAEAGCGRADILLRPKDTRFPTAYVIEFKAAAESADATSALRSAMRQITTKGYAAGLVESGVRPENIRRLGVAIAGKTVKVRLAEGARNPKRKPSRTNDDFGVFVA